MVKRIAYWMLWLVVAIACLFPLVYMARIALTEPSQYRNPIPQWTAPLYTDAFESVLSSSFPRSVLNSALLAASTTIVVLAIAAVASHAIARHRSTAVRKNVMFFALSTRMGPAVVFALPLFLMMTELSLIDTFPAMLAVYVYFSLALAMWLLHGFFRDIPVEIEQAGLVDGLSPLGAFFRITLPNALVGLIATGTLIFIFTWNEFFFALVLTRREMQTFPTLIPGFFGAFTVEWGQMFAASVIGIVPPVLFGVLIRKYLTRGFSMGAVK